MKNVFFIMICLLILTSTCRLSASTNVEKTENSLHYYEAQRLNKRLEEIRQMDIKKMSPAEKNNLRLELRSIRKKHLSTGPVIVISAGALILIVILLILLL